MKKTILLVLSIISVLSLSAQNNSACCAPSRGMFINVPIKDNQINGINNAQTPAKHFVGNGDVPAAISFGTFEFLDFDGTQTVYPQVNAQNQIIWTNGNIHFKSVSLGGNAKMMVNTNGSIRIDNFVANNVNKLLVADASSRYYIGGKTYKLGDLVQGTNIIIELCTNAVLPVTYGAISGVNTGNKIKVDVQITKETNNEIFELHVSEDGNTFSKAATIKSKGDTDSKRDYRFELSSLQVAGLGGIAALLIFCLVIGSYFKKNTRAVLAVAALASIVIACSKNDTVQEDLSKYKYFFIKQIDKDGKSTQSKTFKFNN